MISVLGRVYHFSYKDYMEMPLEIMQALYKKLPRDKEGKIQV